MNAQRLGVGVAVSALAADQLSKNLLLYGFDFIHFAPYHRIGVLPFFDLVMVWNRGVSYGLLQARGALGTVLLTLFSLAAVAALLWWMFQVERKLLAAALGLLAGGALGNVIDRVVYGAVADFFHFYAMGHDWYVFNVADAAITIGVMMLLADAFFRPETKAPSKTPGGEPAIRE